MTKFYIENKISKCNKKLNKKFVLKIYFMSFIKYEYACAMKKLVTNNFNKRSILKLYYCLGIMNIYLYRPFNLT